MLEDYYMKLALKLAKKGLGYVNPNPPVGAVIVKDDVILSTGYHERYGGFHAERNAILKARQKGVDLSNSTLYVTLEPCDHHGKTPPCTDLIIESGIKRVVIASKDPNPISGDGIAKLKKAGIEVEVGILEKESHKLMKFFLKYVTKNLPYVTLKYASTLDGKIADKYGNSKWITDELRKMVHKLRVEHMAVMVGSGTVIKDNPQLNIRLTKSKKSSPIKIILDKEGITLEDWHIYNVYKDQTKVIVFTEKLFKNLPRHIKTINVTEPIEILKALYTEGIDSVLIEGGSTLFSQFLPLSDEIYGFYGAKILGEGRDIFALISKNLENAYNFSIRELRISKNKKEFLVVMEKCLAG
ncbi:MAG: bifunctional diaminohydroxyphosphoribosylaminopyrimidine deaminase/5-amino-6-(5-phosphoribosylamino)uracil reductase RibD [Fervidobacterium sp.]|nr:bifunctional diaminohydroxyphosphoribosylaminopyrimidine deaminase/5-amino-6-(5-phosphoribosylamino)uracil reductase RibD [Fervidobacterium sp.]